jgi:hypothetical protein
MPDSDVTFTGMWKKNPTVETPVVKPDVKPDVTPKEEPPVVTPPVAETPASETPVAETSEETPVAETPKVAVEPGNNAPAPSQVEPEVNTPENIAGLSTKDIKKIEKQTGNIITDIIRGNVPRGSFKVKEAWSVLDLTIALAAAVISIFLGLGTVLGRRRKNDHEEYEGNAKTRALIATIARVFTIAAGVGTIALWLLLDDLSKPIVFVTGWTLYVGLMFVAQVAFLIVYRAFKPVRFSDKKESLV